MSKPEEPRWTLLPGAVLFPGTALFLGAALFLGVAVLGACSGEVATNDFGEGYQGGSEPPAPTQNGESTPSANFPGCVECTNACLACLEEAGEDESEQVACVLGVACQAYLNEFADRVPEYTADDNILQTPETSPDVPSEGECAGASSLCDYCYCTGGTEEDCVDFC